MLKRIATKSNATLKKRRKKRDRYDLVGMKSYYCPQHRRHHTSVSSPKKQHRGVLREIFPKHFDLVKLSS